MVAARVCAQGAGHAGRGGAPLDDAEAEGRDGHSGDGGRDAVPEEATVVQIGAGSMAVVRRRRGGAHGSIVPSSSVAASSVGPMTALKVATVSKSRWRCCAQPAQPTQPAATAGPHERSSSCMVKNEKHTNDATTLWLYQT